MSRNRRKRNDAAYYFYKMPRLPRLCGGGLVTLDHPRAHTQVKIEKRAWQANEYEPRPTYSHY